MSNRQTVMDELELPPRRLAAPRRQHRPNVLAQWAWGLWDMVLRLIEFGVKMFGAALLALGAVVFVALLVWNLAIEPGVKWLQDYNSTTTTTTEP